MMESEVVGKLRGCFTQHLGYDEQLIHRFHILQTETQSQQRIQTGDALQVDFLLKHSEGSFKKSKKKTS
jgi:hypothetical protein